MQTSQHPIDFAGFSSPPRLPQINGYDMTGISGPQMKNEAYMDDVSGPSSHDESPSRTFGALNMFGKAKAGQKMFGKAEAGQKTTKDGTPAKKRGPKRDSKPAQNRRQELNRQAQRTHRERKELYTKGLEMEVIRLKEVFARMSKEGENLRKRAHNAEQQVTDANFDALRHENERLKQLLQVNGITYDRILPVTNSLQTPTQTAAATNGQMLPIRRQISPPLGQYYNNASQPQQQDIQFNSLPYRLAPASPDSGQTMMQTNGNMDIMPSQASQRSLSSGGISASPSSASSSQSGFSYYPPSSTNGSSFIPPMLTPTSTTNRSSPVYPTTSQLQRENSDTIDAVILDSTVSTLRPPLGQGLINGKVVRDTSDGRILQTSMDHDQLGIDFILALEESCRDHQQHCNARALPSDENEINLELSGHAMMLTNPPASHMQNDPKTPWFQPPDIPNRDLLMLMDTAQKIPMRQGEITPILALKRIREDGRYGLMTRKQFEVLTQRLTAKTRCYGFGSVLEEFRVTDELNRVFGV